MYQVSTLIRLLVLSTAFSLIVLPGFEAEARPSKSSASLKKAKKAKARKLRKKRARKRRAKKVTYKKILKWWKAGTSNGRILARAKKAGYVPSKRDVRRLQKKQVSAQLIAALKGGEVKVFAAQPRKARSIDIQTIYSEDDMDFDSVPPPAGTPNFVRVKKVKNKKTIDRSLRPSAPFKKGQSSLDTKAKKRRTVVAASR